MFDLIIRSGDVVTPEGVVRGDVAVAGETIAAIATPGALPTESAKHLIDATGHIVMPGGIDPHVHLHHGEMGAKRSTAVHLAANFLDK
jgi:dihydroorotase-like cyclic amidohydrolase